MRIHTTATWPARDDRRAAMVWLAIFLIYVGVGFGFDLRNYLHEKPAVPAIVHVHAVATTLWLLTATALVLLVETGNVRLHRRLGWFAAGYAALLVVIAHEAIPVGFAACDSCGFDGHGTLLQWNLAIDLAIVPGELGAEDAVTLLQSPRDWT